MPCVEFMAITDAEKLKLFLANLKGVALRWFMGLGLASISTWNYMKETFLSNYQDYCRTRDVRVEIFRMMQKEEESLEDYVELFHYNLQRSKHSDLDLEILKTIFLRGMRDDSLNTLNLLVTGDISQETFVEIIKLVLRCSQGSSKGRSTTQDAFVCIQKSAGGGVTRAEIKNLFENFKTDILSTLSTQITTTQIKKAQ